MPPLQIADKSGVDERSYNALRNGERKIDARLDLHGKSKAQAFSLLCEFVKKTAADGKRCLLIITGKGRKEDAGNTLRDALPDWLNHPEIRPFILTYTQAAPKLGGSGAYTILLKRKRDY
jgi:DNA-nicking Smr family endonuclease